MAKKIINFICELARTVNSDPVASKYLKVAFVEDYNVTMAERLMPAAEISEQISLAGTEASGTSNMKLMLNGAVTLGTEDGANVEIHEAVGDDNIIIFGMNTNEVDELKRKGYDPMNFYMNNIYIRKVIDYINNYGLNGKKFPDISNVVHLDPYMTLADFEDYKLAQEKAEKIWLDKAKFDRMSLVNIAESGRFSADRAINEYAQNIWHTKSAKTASEPSKKGKTDK
jgi:starch phosphorylase